MTRLILTVTALLLLASTVQAGPMRQLSSPPARPTCSPKVIYVVPVYRAPRRVIIYR